MINEDNIIDIWLGLKEFFDKKQLETVASKYVDILADNGVQDHVFKSILGSDDALDDAIEYYLGESELDIDDDIDFESEDYDKD